LDSATPVAKSEPVDMLNIPKAKTPEVPINNNPTFTPNEKVIGDMYREGKIPLAQLTDDPRLTSDQKSLIVRTVPNIPKAKTPTTLTEIAKESTDKVFADKLAAGEKEGMPVERTIPTGG
jgi:hypothetical protein